MLAPLASRRSYAPEVQRVQKLMRAAGALAAAIGLGGFAAPQAPEPPANAILLFVASWCAPCHAEVRALPDLARAAAPLRVLVVPIDRHRGTRRMIAAVPEQQLLRLEPSAAAALMRSVAGAAPGLPTSVALDGRGRRCGVVRRPLTPQDAALLAERCGA
jgi:thiol-disulfide isomerase/thioredoxin